MTDIPLPEFREVLKQKFVENRNIDGIQIIDRKVAETYKVLFDFGFLKRKFNYFKHIEAIKMTYYNTYMVRNFLFGENIDPKPKDFLSKFLHGKQ